MVSSGPGLGFDYVYADEVIALGSVLPVVCIVFVAIRFFTRHLQKAGLKLDDWLAFSACIMVIGMGACLIAGAALKAMGYPTPPPPSGLTPEEEEFYVAPSTRTEQIEFPFQIMMVLAYGFIKLSYLYLYRRVFVTHSGQAVDIFLKVMIVVVALWTLAFELLIIFACGSHVSANWSSPGEENKYCVPVGYTSEYGLVVSDLILDGLIFLIPIPLIWKLQMTTKRKFAVSGVFLLGASALGASVARLILYVKEVHGLLAGADIDAQLTATVAYYWSLLEVGLALIAACLPATAYCFSHWREIPLLYSLRNSVSRFSSHSLEVFHRTQTSRATKSETGSQKELHSFVDNGGEITRTVSIDLEHQAVKHPNLSTAESMPEWYPGKLTESDGPERF